MADDKRSQQVSLGCGTLILIALIVLIFGGGGVSRLKGDVDNLRTEVSSLRTEVGSLRRAVVVQTEEIKALQRKVDRLRPAGGETEDAEGTE